MRDLSIPIHMYIYICIQEYTHTLSMLANVHCVQGLCKNKLQWIDSNDTKKLKEF